MTDEYYIVRMYQNGRRPRVMRKGLTLEQAQEHCNDPATSSMTKPQGKYNQPPRPATIARWHEQQKHWFDGYRKV